MAEKIVVGLFETKGIAEDVRNRLMTEGLPPADINVLLLRETAPLPFYMEAEVAALEIDPLLLGNVRETFARHIRNGETAVFVRAEDEEAVDAVIDTMRQFAPLQIIVTPAEAQVNGV
ncbi:MAG TPA: hypothetical protein VHU15_11815 [Stellaceae bacterium]|nr:hypothetical protein [Stellaceae bacterium]